MKITRNMRAVKFFVFLLTVNICNCQSSYSRISDGWPYIDSSTDLLDVIDFTGSDTDNGEMDIDLFLCGNGTVNLGEECDDGDDDDCNACDSSCHWKRAIKVINNGIGAESFVNIPCLPSVFTLEFWFRIDGTNREECYIFHEPLSYKLAVKSEEGRDVVYNDQLCREIGGCSGSGGTFPFGMNEWHHIAAVIKHIDTEESAWVYGFYIDGIWTSPHSYIEDPTSTISCNLPLGIGYNCTITIDEMMLSEGELYRDDFVPSHIAIINEHTVACWSFNEMIGDVIMDISGNGHDINVIEGELVEDGCHQ
jgi:hypothetical protein